MAEHEVEVVARAPRAHANAPAARSRSCDVEPQIARGALGDAARPAIRPADGDRRVVRCQFCHVHLVRLRPQRVYDGPQVGGQPGPDGDLGERLGAADRGVADGIRGELLVRDDESVVVAGPDPGVREADLLDDARRRPATSTSSPRRSGWVNAIRMPATKLPIVRWLAKPITSPITAEDARTPPATACTCGITSSADITPTKTIVVTDRPAQDAVARHRLGRELAARDAAQSTTLRDQRRERRSPPRRSRAAARTRSSRSLFAPVDRFPPRESLLEPVPVRRPRSSPTCQQSRTSSPSRRAGKSTSPRSTSFTGRPSASSSSTHASSSFSERVELARARTSPTAKPLAVAGDRLHELAPLALELAHAFPQRHHALGRRPHLREGAVSLGRSERAVGHGRAAILRAAQRRPRRASRRGSRSSVSWSLSHTRSAPTSGAPDSDVLYRYSTAISGVVLYAIMLLVTLAIAGFDRDLLALRRPRSWPVALGLGVLIIVVVFIAIAVLEPLLHGGEEQGLTPDEWQPDRAGAYVLNGAVTVLFVAVRGGAALPRRRLLAPRALRALDRDRCDGQRVRPRARPHRRLRPDHAASAARSRGCGRASTASCPGC